MYVYMFSGEGGPNNNSLLSFITFIIHSDQPAVSIFPTRDLFPDSLIPNHICTADDIKYTFYIKITPNNNTSGLFKPLDRTAPSPCSAQAVHLEAQQTSW